MGTLLSVCSQHTVCMTSEWDQPGSCRCTGVLCHFLPLRPEAQRLASDSHVVSPFPFPVTVLKLTGKEGLRSDNKVYDEVDVTA